MVSTAAGSSIEAPLGDMRIFAANEAFAPKGVVSALIKRPECDLSVILI